MHDPIRRRLNRTAATAAGAAALLLGLTGCAPAEASTPKPGSGQHAGTVENTGHHSGGSTVTTTSTPPVDDEHDGHRGDGHATHGSRDGHDRTRGFYLYCEPEARGDGYHCTRTDDVGPVPPPVTGPPLVVVPPPVVAPPPVEPPPPVPTTMAPIDPPPVDPAPGGADGSSGGGTGGGASGGGTGGGPSPETAATSA